MESKPPGEQIDDIIALHPDWRGAMLAELRRIIRQADPAVVEAVKWKKPSRPEGVAVWMRDGNICFADVLSKAVRLTFPSGASLEDPRGLFNTRLDSKTVRAVDFGQGETIDEAALAALIVAVTQGTPASNR